MNELRDVFMAKQVQWNVFGMSFGTEIFGAEL